MKIFRIIFLYSFCFLAFNFSSAQIESYPKGVLDTLCSNEYNGRGYVFGGDKKAAEFISNQYRNFKLEKFGNNYFQKFPIVVNTFPGKMQVTIGGKSLSPGIEYIVNLYSHSVSGNFETYILDKKTLLSPKKLYDLQLHNNSSKFMVVDLTVLNDQQQKVLLQDLFIYKELAAGVVLISDKKLNWGTSQYLTNLPLIIIKKEVWLNNPKSIFVDIESKLEENYYTNNVLGYKKGTQYPDSFIVVTAHYDHLGCMGKETYFPGANDNASGVAMMLSLAKELSAKASKYSILFIAFTGEEMGLLGSNYFVDNPLINLKEIKFVFNIDLMGTGETGVMMVNSVANPILFDRMVSINEKLKSVPLIKARSNSSNSDHYPFTQKNVNAVFVYAMGNYTYYHDPLDNLENLPLTKFNEMKNLFLDFLISF